MFGLLPLFMEPLEFDVPVMKSTVIIRLALKKTGSCQFHCSERVQVYISSVVV